eukprot:2294798-Rhodomonas_salina.1
MGANLLVDGGERLQRQAAGPEAVGLREDVEEGRGEGPRSSDGQPARGGRERVQELCGAVVQPSLHFPRLVHQHMQSACLAFSPPVAVVAHVRVAGFPAAEEHLPLLALEHVGN